MKETQGKGIRALQTSASAHRLALPANEELRRQRWGQAGLCHSPGTARGDPAQRLTGVTGGTGTRARSSSQSQGHPNALPVTPDLRAAADAGKAWNQHRAQRLKVSAQPQERQHPLLTATARAPALNEDDWEPSSETRRGGVCTHTHVFSLLPRLSLSQGGAKATLRPVAAGPCSASQPGVPPRGGWGAGPAAARAHIGCRRGLQSAHARIDPRQLKHLSIHLTPSLYSSPTRSDPRILP